MYIYIYKHICSLCFDPFQGFLPTTNLLEITFAKIGCYVLN